MLVLTFIVLNNIKYKHRVYDDLIRLRTDGNFNLDHY